MRIGLFKTTQAVMLAAVSALSVLNGASRARADLTFTVLASPSDAVNNTGASEGSSAVDGTTLYTIANGNHATVTALPQISQITGLGTSPTDSAFVTEANWTVNGAGVSTGVSGQLWNDGSYLEMYDSISGNVIRMNKVTNTNAGTMAGTVFEYATKAEFYPVVAAANSNTTQTNITASATALTATGDLAILDSSKGIYETNGQDTVTTLISPSALTTGTNGPGTASVNTFTIDGNNVFVGVSSKGMYEYNTTSSTWVNGSQPLFTPSTIEGLTGNSGSSYLSTASFFAPDGNVYFFDQTAKDIMVFDPNNASSLRVAVSSAQINSIEGSTAVSNLTWYNGNIAWDNVNTVGQGVYAAVPEPASLSVLAIGAVGLLSRRSRRQGQVL
jgi:hypothetical protein